MRARVSSATWPRSDSATPTMAALLKFVPVSQVVFGSDLPWYSQHYHAGAVLFARITDDDRHDILHCNAERLLGRHLQ